MSSSTSSLVPCPVCSREFQNTVIEDHVNKCLFLNAQTANLQQTSKRSSSQVTSTCSIEKRVKVSGTSSRISDNAKLQANKVGESSTSQQGKEINNIPLAEKMRPHHLDDIIGQNKSFGCDGMLYSMLKQNKIPNMILWGPPGCGKTSVANVIATICKEQSHLRFVKLSATMSGIADVKEVVKVAKNEMQFKRQTVLFMDEIHRFNKLQQDTFLPHVENGTIILVGATTENPSFSLNNALLSRCRVVVLEKLSIDDVVTILKRALRKTKEAVIADKDGKIEETDFIPKYIISVECIGWVAGMCDGDARVALGAVELALAAAGPPAASLEPAVITLEHVKEGIKRCHVVYSRGDGHYDTVSALHKSVRAGDDNAALYWTARMLHAGDDPLYIARRLVRAASEDIGLADPSALVEAVACLQGCQQLGAPECDVLLAQTAVRLARARKCRAVYLALQRCRRALAAPAPLPPVPLHLRNAPTALMRQLGYGDGYNLLHKDESGLTYMPEGLEDVNYFQESYDDEETC